MWQEIGRLKLFASNEVVNGYMICQNGYSDIYFRRLNE